MIQTYNKGFEPDSRSLSMANFVFEIDLDNETFSLIKNRKDGELLTNEPLEDFLITYTHYNEWESKLLRKEI